MLFGHLTQNASSWCSFFVCLTTTSTSYISCLTEFVAIVQDHDGFSDLQDPEIVELSPVLHTSPTNGIVEAPRAIDPVLHTYPPSQMYLQINHHVQVDIERVGHVQMV